MKKIKTTIIITCTQEYYDKYYPKIKSELESGETKKKFTTDFDKKAGIIDADITLEDISDEPKGA